MLSEVLKGYFSHFEVVFWGKGYELTSYIVNSFLNSLLSDSRWKFDGNSASLEEHVPKTYTKHIFMMYIWSF